jgi:hypothetical protein
MIKEKLFALEDIDVILFFMIMAHDEISFFFSFKKMDKAIAIFKT